MPTIGWASSVAPVDPRNFASPNAYTSRAAPGSDGPAVTAGTPTTNVATAKVETPSRATATRAITDRAPECGGRGARGFVGSFSMGTSTAAIAAGGTRETVA